MERKEVLGIMAAIIYAGAYDATNGQGNCETESGCVSIAESILQAVGRHTDPFRWHDYSDCDPADRPCRHCRYDTIPDEVKSRVQIGG